MAVHQPAGRIVVPFGLRWCLWGDCNLSTGYSTGTSWISCCSTTTTGLPAFNVADSAITVGVVLMLFDGFFLERRRQQVGAGDGVNASSEQ